MFWVSGKTGQNSTLWFTRHRIQLIFSVNWCDCTEANEHKMVCWNEKTVSWPFRLTKHTSFSPDSFSSWTEQRQTTYLLSTSLQRLYIALRFAVFIFSDWSDRLESWRKRWSTFNFWSSFANKTFCSVSPGVSLPFYLANTLTRAQGGILIYFRRKLCLSFHLSGFLRDLCLNCSIS